MDVYLDNAATTRMFPQVIEAMKIYMDERFGNPSTNYAIGYEAKKELYNARETIAKTINADNDEIYFTSGGSEGDNWAIKGVADAIKDKKHIITSSIEHKAILNSCKYLEDRGYDVTYISPDERGFINPKDVEKSIREDTLLCSIMMANNEIGTINQIQEIAAICKKHGVIIHTDAVQAYGHMEIDVRELGVDLLTTSSHKFHGPTGTGFLYIRSGTPISPLIHGGQQQHGNRAGTENVLGIIGMSKAAEIVNLNLEQNVSHMIKMRNYFIDQVLQIKNVSLNGSYLNRLCNNINITIKGVQGEAALIMLDMCGISASSGSACNSDDAKPSHVLTAIGLSPDDAGETLRFTISEDISMEEVNYTIKQLKRIIEDLRSVYGHN